MRWYRYFRSWLSASQEGFAIKETLFRKMSDFAGNPRNSVRAAARWDPLRFFTRDC